MLANEAEASYASMGPRSFDRGNPIRQTWLCGDLFWLQWGRDQLTAETSTMLRGFDRAHPSSFNGAAII